MDFGNGFLHFLAMDSRKDLNRSIAKKEETDQVQILASASQTFDRP